jgi:hypothetical protein
LPLNLYCWGAYAAYDHVATPYRDDDYVVNGMVRAVKGTLPARQFAYVRALDGNRYRIAAGTEPLAFAVFGQWGASLLAQWKSALIIPVPSSSHTTFGIPFTGSKLAESIAARMPTEANVHAAPILAFKSKMPRASAGESGGRDRTAIQAALQVTSLSSLKGQSVVLVDDVCTTGAHLVACANFLRDQGANVDYALCLARTVNFQHPTPLQVPPESLE